MSDAVPRLSPSVEKFTTVLVEVDHSLCMEAQERCCHSKLTSEVVTSEWNKHARIHPPNWVRSDREHKRYALEVTEVQISSGRRARYHATNAMGSPIFGTARGRPRSESGIGLR